MRCEETSLGCQEMLQQYKLLAYTFHLLPIHANPNPEMTQQTAAMPKVPLKHSEP